MKKIKSVLRLLAKNSGLEVEMIEMSPLVCFLNKFFREFFFSSMTFKMCQKAKLEFNCVNSNTGTTGDGGTSEIENQKLRCFVFYFDEQ